METLQYAITINAGTKKVWDTMLEDRTYRVWTKPFREGSYYEGNWTKGSEMRFLAPTDDGGEAGMVSRIRENIPHQFLSIEHRGLIINGVVDTTSEEVNKWSSAFENYTFTESGGRTEVKVAMHVVEEYKAMFDEIWPQALNALKALCEKS